MFSSYWLTYYFEQCYFEQLANLFTVVEANPHRLPSSLSQIGKPPSVLAQGHPPDWSQADKIQMKKPGSATGQIDACLS
jgi:hypothetical protein